MSAPAAISAQSGSSPSSSRAAAAAVLACAWALPAACFSGLLATRFHLWSASGIQFLGSPVDVLVARTLAFGAVAALLFPRAGLPLMASVAVAADLSYLRARGFASLHAPFILVEAAGVALCLVPAQLFARWTRDDRRLALRAALHPLFHAALLLGILPALIVALGGGSWSAAFARPSWLNKIYLQLLLVPATLLISSVQEFVFRGKGTPMPADAPRLLVVTGPYAYVRNPMQLGKITMLLGWAAFWRNPWFAATAGGGLLYSLLIAIPREDRALRIRFGPAWTGYSARVRRWLPHWRPFAPLAPARLYLDLACGSCSQLATWLNARSSVGLEIVSAAQHPGAPLARMRYGTGDGSSEDDGILALARALEHVNLAWAFCGWMMRLPGVSWLAQLLADALDPRAAARCITGNTPATEDVP